MTVSRNVTVAGWIVLGTAMMVASIGALASRGRFPTLAALLRSATRTAVIRVIALAGWAWIGWHFFVRTSR
jgi:hypothetical protein